MTTTTFSLLNPTTAFNTDRLAALALGAAILLSSPSAASASSTALSSPNQKLQLFLVGNSRDPNRKGALAAPIAPSYQDVIISELGRLSAGWAGEASLAPSADVQNDVARVVSALSLTSDSVPEVHVDDDGTTSLIWAYDADRLLSLEFFGKGYVACTFAHSDPARSMFKKIPVTDEVTILSFIEAVKLDEAEAANAAA